MDVQAVKDEVLAAFEELFGMSHARFVTSSSIAASSDAWQQAERLARRRVAAEDWASYRSHMASQRARQSRRRANGNQDGSVSEPVTTTRDKGTTVSHRADGRGARRRAKRSA